MFFRYDFNYRDIISLQPQIRLLCAVFSLPLCPDSANPSGGEANNPVNELALNNLDQIVLHKLLLVGSDGSGTSTIFKQVKT